MFREHYGAMVGYSFSERHASKTEQLVEYGGLARRPYKDGVGEIHRLLPPVRISSSHGRPKKGDKSPPKVRPGSTWDSVHVGNNPPSKNHSGKYNNFSSDESDDDVVCDENGYCYPKPKHSEDYDTGNYDYAPNYGYNTTNPNNYNSLKNHPSHETSYPNDYKSNPNGNGYTTPYPQPYYETPNPNGNGYIPKSYYEKPKPNGNDYSTPPPQPYYEKPKSNINEYTTPPPQSYYEAPNINKPRLVDRPNKGIVESQLENMRISSPKSPKKHRSPFGSPKSPFTSSPGSPYSSSPLKDQGYRETIDSGEARRRYGGAAAGEPDEQYEGTIDGQEAAKRYGGVFVKY